MPVRQIGGISRANLAGVASLVRKGNSLTVGFNANQKIPQASVSIVEGTKALVHENVDLTPEHTWTHEVPNAQAEAKYTIEIKDRRGVRLLRQTEGEYDWTPASEIHVGAQPSHRIPDAKDRGYDDWIEFGKDEELNGRLLSALEVYKQALTKFPNGFVAQKAAGRLAVGLLRFEEAKELLEPLQGRDTTDAELSYYLGLAYEGLGDDTHARFQIDAIGVM